jgi:hypothetical protein
MKKQNLFFVAIILLSASQAFSQGTYSTSEFEVQGDGVLYISETDSVTGKIEYNELSPGSVRIVDASGKSKKYSGKEVIGFKTANPKRVFHSVKSDGLDKSMLFYEDITPNGGKKLLLLKSFIQDGLLVSGGTVKGDWENAIYSPSAKKLIPANFKKLAEQLKDCSALAGKISNNEKGYYHGLIATPQQKEEVLRNIVNDYNTCQ